jgi:hypothetical protein
VEVAVTVTSAVARAVRLARKTVARVTRRPPPYDVAWEPHDQRVPTFPGLVSQACTAAQLAAPEYGAWCERMREPVLVHRKQWEWCYILQALAEAGVLRPGARGLGFGVGTEPLTAVIAAHGCNVLATDLAPESSNAHAWIATDQHASALADLNRARLCAPDEFAARVRFRPVDMNAVPDDLTDFDFTWSSCALEHLGDLDAGTRFFHRQLACLRPGGVGVHTTEYNVASNDRTVERGHTVLYRRRDLERLVADVTAAGHAMVATFALGSRPADRHIDTTPWTNIHLKVAADGQVLTSFGLLARRDG